ncbi:MAG: hypothetical protein NT067_05285 [Candidatus Diapherotrites archaeon]|nr:hypothetical protein [Candidatus Diapherotrites archaeon]
MPSSDSPREISRVEILEHPFCNLHHLEYEAIQLTPKQMKHMADKWKQRVKEIASDPNAILVIVKSKYEAGESADSHGRRNAKETAELRAIESDFYAYARKMLERRARDDRPAPGNRLFLEMEAPRTAADSHIDFARFRKELEARNMELHSKAVVWAYGAYQGDVPLDKRYLEDWERSGCVNQEFREFCNAFNARFEWKIVPSLSVQHSRRSKIYEGRDYRGSMEAPHLEKWRAAIERNRQGWQPTRKSTRPR